MGDLAEGARALGELLVPATLETLGMVGASSLLSSLLGLGLGVFLFATGKTGVAPWPTAHRLVGAVVNVGRSVPFVVLMVAVVPLTRLLVGTSIGSGAAVVPLVIAAVPYVARQVEAALREVPGGAVEAVTVMGATPWQVIRVALLREALPSLLRAATLTTINLISYSAMAGAIGGGGLGDLAVRYGYQRFRTDVMVAAVIVLVVLVQGIQALGERLAQRVDRRGREPS